MTRPANVRVSPPADVDAAIERVRAAGGRVTAGLRALLDVLFERRDGMSVDDLDAALDSIDATTIYRSLMRLEQLGVIEHVHFSRGAALYRVVGAPTVTVCCESCGAVTSVAAAEFDALIIRLRERYGVELHLGHVALSGRCVDGCAPGSPDAAAPRG